MKYGPCEKCLIRPACSALCDDKFKDLCISASIEEKKVYNDVTLTDFLKQLHKEGMEIRKIEVTDEIQKTFVEKSM